MADKKISQLTAASTPLTGTEELAIVQSGVTKKATIEDVKGYKVYTALLTQSGGDDPLTLSSGPVTKGVTYRISANSDGDFSNVGAPNNNENTWFVAINNEVPNSYGTDCQLFYNNAAPVVTVLENTIGNVWFTYQDVGTYFLNSNGLFITNKTYVTIQSQPTQGSISDGVNFALIDYENYFTTNTVKILTGLINNSNLDGLLLNTPIEIRVYS
jgi:hypothetical protein